ncbi:hypothetical protein CFOL_v3_10524 [Cephalotus follicularis]|uniref:Uncharacterized protein n=1 Tax=Cephalotus follicularis TaxID=3775 RepID=A0A1Q3BGE8_CEPFO|nr:hypothetical protein CFOL_v3_10524 [Cephalotus follicularis]
MNMCMDSSSSSSASMQAIITSNNQFDPFSMTDNISYDMAGASGLFTIPSYLGPVGVGDGFYGDYGILEPNYKMGLERDLCLPPLESRIIEENKNNIVTNYNSIIDVKSNNNHFNNTCLNNKEGLKVEGMVGFENQWQGENLRMGEWDFEGLMENLSSFPFLDFQLE